MDLDDKLKMLDIEHQIKLSNITAEYVSEFITAFGVLVLIILSVSACMLASIYDESRRHDAIIEKALESK